MTWTRQARGGAHFSNEMTKIEITHAWKLSVDLLKPCAFVHTHFLLILSPDPCVTFRDKWDTTCRETLSVPPHPPHPEARSNPPPTPPGSPGFGWSHEATAALLFPARGVGVCLGLPVGDRKWLKQGIPHVDEKVCSTQTHALLHTHTHARNIPAMRTRIRVDSLAN